MAHKERFRMSIGNQLKRARQKKQLSIDAVYRQTKIYPDVLSAIESDNFSKLPNPIYVKIFLKEYARFLGLDVEVILKEYAEILPATEPVKEERLAATRGSEMGIRKFRPVLTGFLIIIVLALSFRVLDKARGKFLSWKAIRAQQAGERKAAEVQASMKKIAVDAPVEKPVVKQADVSISKDEKLDLAIKINDDVWAEIKRDGDIIFKGILKKGTVRNWQADNSFEIWTGNASVMELILNNFNLGIVGRGVRRGVIVDRQGIRK